MPETRTETLPDRLRRLMAAAGFNQKSLARAAGLNETAVRDILNGRSKRPAYTTLSGIALALGCSVEYLADGTGPERRPFGARAPGLAEPAVEFQAMSMLLDSSLAFRVTQRFFERLDRDRPNWTPRERAYALLITYQRVLGRGRVDDPAIMEALDMLS